MNSASPPSSPSGAERIAQFETNIGPDSRFESRWLILTAHGLSVHLNTAAAPALRPVESSGNAAKPLTNRSQDAIHPLSSDPFWKLEEIAEIRISDRNGIGFLSLLGHERLLAEWRFTANRLPAAEQFVVAFRSLVRSGRTDGEASKETVIPEAEDVVPVAVATSALLRLLKFARPRAPAILLGIVLTFATTLVGLVPSYLTMPLVDQVLIPPAAAPVVATPPAPPATVSSPTATSPAAKGAKIVIAPARPLSPQQRLRMLMLYLAGLTGAAAATWALSWAKGVVLARVSERISADLRNRTYAHLQKLSVEFFGGKRTGDLMSRISTDTDRLCNFLSDNLVDFVTDLLMITSIAVLLVSIDPLLAAASLCPFPLIAWLIFYSRDRLQQGFLASGRVWSQMSSVLADTIPGIRVVKAFAQEYREIYRFREANRRVVEANDRVNAIWTFFWPVVVFLNQLGTIVVWAFGAWRVLEGEITLGVLTLFLANISQFYGRLEAMSRMVNATQRAGASAQRIFEILDRVPSVPEPLRPIPVGPLTGQIELRGVGFRYGSRQVLENLNLTIQPGEMVGLVGHTGAGKSTLINLICRFFDVGEGAILVDGTDIRAFTVADYRRRIGLVLQDPFLFYGTIAENIAYGRPEATREEIISAAKAAFAHEFILRLPDAYDSIVGERGQSLSGGERQRISIARALLIDPRILILDEATSAVDTETERQIQHALDRLVEGRTTIAIAHRLSTLRKANRIVVLEHGQIVESGPHDELLAKNGAYARLHRAQVELTSNIAW